MPDTPQGLIARYEPTGGYAVSADIMRKCITLMAARTTPIQLADGTTLEKTSTGFASEVSYTIGAGDHRMILKPHFSDGEVIAGMIITVSERYPADFEDKTKRGHFKERVYDLNTMSADLPDIVPQMFEKPLVQFTTLIEPSKPAGEKHRSGRLSQATFGFDEPSTGR